MTDDNGNDKIDHTPYVPSIERRVHVLVCALLGLDDESHEDDEEAAPLEGTIMQIVTASNQQAAQKAHRETAISIRKWMPENSDAELMVLRWIEANRDSFTVAQPRKNDRRQQ